MTDIVDRLRGEHWWLDVTGEEVAVELERLQAAIRDAIARYEAEGDADYMVQPLRAALEPKP